jgi:hypothetical protein
MNLSGLFNGLQLSFQLAQAGSQVQNPQLLTIFKSFFALLNEETSLEPVGEMTEALIKTPAFDQKNGCKPRPSGRLFLILNILFKNFYWCAPYRTSEI